MTGHFMRKALMPMLASLALCGGATAVLLITNAHAQVEAAKHKPMMVAQQTPDGRSGPAGQRPGMDRPAPNPARMAEHLKQMCQDGFAREAGALAYLEARLSLTGNEKPLFERWKNVKLDIARHHTDTCAAREFPRTEKMPTIVDRMARQQDRLKNRLADLDAERPALEAFYNSMSAEQKQEFGRAAMRLMMLRERLAGGPGMERGPMAHGMMEHRMGPGMMGPGMMEPGMMHPPLGPDGPPGAPGDAPSAPPPQ
jgi:hypothetical protein